MPQDHSNCGIVISQVMMPCHANPAGNINGGVIMRLIDDAAFVIASRHARCNVVTASIDRIDFHNPVHIGDLLILRASLNLTHRSSMEIGVRVEGEEMRTGHTRHIASAYLTFVAVNQQGRPVPVPPHHPEGPEALRRQKEASKRRTRRLKNRELSQTGTRGITT